MKKFFAGLASKDWFLTLFPLVIAAAVSYLSFLISGHLIDWLPLVVLAAAAFLINRHVFGTLESHFGIALWFINAALFYSSKPSASVAFGGFLTGYLFAMMLTSWMDEPNVEEIRTPQQ